MTEYRETLHQGLWLGAQRRNYELCDSSIDRLWKWVDEGAPAGAVVTARAQSSGRGRQGRSWLSEAGQGLYYSVYLTPRVEARELPAIALVTALGLCDLALQLGAAEIGIKWPNDLLLRERKLAGILVESRAGAAQALVIGIGLNLRPPSGGWPEELRGRAISLQEAGADSDFELLTDWLCGHLQRRVESFQENGFAALRAEYQSFDVLRGRSIDYAHGGHLRRGVAEGVHGDGALRVVDEGGVSHRLYAGEVHLRP